MNRGVNARLQARHKEMILRIKAFATSLTHHGGKLNGEHSGGSSRPPGPRLVPPWQLQPSPSERICRKTTSRL